MHVSPHFRRISEKLSLLELSQHDADDDVLTPAKAFVGTYDEVGLQHVLQAYALSPKLTAMGLDPLHIAITSDDPFHHALQLQLPDGVPVMDLRLHLCCTRLPGIKGAILGRIDVVVVEWLRMQNPHARFTAARPRLPGQTYPGTGLGRDVLQLLVLMCERIHRDAMITLPEHYHQNEMYQRIGFMPLSPDDDVNRVRGCTSALSLAERAWACERGFVRRDDGSAFVHHPRELLLPIHPRIKVRPHPAGGRPFVLDATGFVASLRREPVEGIDADDVARRLHV
jgi:hypothetical protein